MISPRYTTSGVYQLLRQFKLTVPEPPSEAAADALNDWLVADLVRLYQDERLSLAVIARRYGHDPDWVKARLRRAGIPLRAPGRKATTDEDRVRSLLDDGLRVPEIADARLFDHDRVNDHAKARLGRAAEASAWPQPHPTTDAGPGRPPPSVCR